MAEAARSLGVNANLLYKWKDQNSLDFRCCVNRTGESVCFYR
ncbi:MAG: hypothetical protein GXZ10_06535 [Gammaproteobacteria bacterium]|nr:hypothetical protein [Gammaproteobacteria bacterium]